MDGDAGLEALLGYLSRLLGAPVTADQTLPLRSVHRSALASWARRQGVAVRFAAITASAPVTARQLLQADAPAMTAAPLPAAGVAPVQAAAAGGVQVLGIGIDIESVDALPATDDYRAHPFYQDHFTPAELAHCINQADVRASLCGTWAAKEAILKSGMETAPSGRLAAIEIAHDAAGRPMRAGCQLSISHTATTAVAVCLAQAPAAAAGPVQAMPSEAPPKAPPPPRATAWKIAAAVAGALAIGGVTLAAH